MFQKLFPVLRPACLCLFTLLLFCGQGSEKEPPMKVCDNGKGVARRVILLSDNTDTLLYRIDYPGCKLSSIASVYSYTGAILTETFSDKWVINYEYDNAVDEMGKFPTAFSIYGPDGEKLINRYERVETIMNVGGRYKTASGKEKSVTFFYFDVQYLRNNTFQHPQKANFL